MNEVESYILQFPLSVQERLNAVRDIIKNAEHDIVESFAYGMPAYKLYKKPLVYFGAFKHHIGFYATPSGHSNFAKEMSQYKQGKGSVQFPLDEPIPYNLIEQIVYFRVAEIKSNIV